MLRPLTPRRSWLRGLDLNRFLTAGPTYLQVQDVPGWYGSRTAADDLWVLPTSLAHRVRTRGRVPFLRPPRGGSRYLVGPARQFELASTAAAPAPTTEPRLVG